MFLKREDQRLKNDLSNLKKSVKVKVVAGEEVLSLPDYYSIFWNCSYERRSPPRPHNQSIKQTSLYAAQAQAGLFRTATLKGKVEAL